MGRPGDLVTIDTPSLTSVLYQISPIEPFSQRPGKTIFSYDFLISDILRDQKEASGTSLCDQRNENQIVDQCTPFLYRIFSIFI